MLWIIVLTAVLQTGDVMTDIRWPLNNQMNSEAECRKQAEIEANNIQLKIGSDNGIVLYNCHSIPFKDIKAIVSAAPSL